MDHQLMLLQVWYVGKYDIKRFIVKEVVSRLVHRKTLASHEKVKMRKH